MTAAACPSCGHPLDGPAVNAAGGAGTLLQGSDSHTTPTAPTCLPERPGLARAIEETLHRFPQCKCRLDARLTDEQLTAFGGGCTGLLFICPRLDAVRRRIL